MTPWKVAASLAEPGTRPGPLRVAGLVTRDPTLRQEVPALLTPETAVVHLDPAGTLPCSAPVNLVMIDSDLLARGAGARWLGDSCLPRLLLARRLDRLLARGGADRLRLLCGAVVVDQARLEAWVAGEALTLTPREFGVLRELARRCDRAVARRELLAAVWGWDEDHASNVVDVAVAGLRRKLAAHAGLIRTVRGGTGWPLRWKGAAHPGSGREP